MAIRPEIRVFIAALRAGKSHSDAFAEYCWARLAVPISRGDLEHFESRGDPMKCRPVWSTMAAAQAADAFDEGADDATIADEFAKGAAYDKENGIIWRVMRDDERPTNGDLVRAMGMAERELAAALLGSGYVARAFASRGRYY